MMTQGEAGKREAERQQRRMLAGEFFDDDDPNEQTSFGSRGTRYDEACDFCGRTRTLDNLSGLCRSCHVGDA